MLRGSLVVPPSFRHRRYRLKPFLQYREIRSQAHYIFGQAFQYSRFHPLLRNELEDTEKGLKNIADAIQQGIITNTTKQCLEELEALESDLEVKILQTELQQTILTEEKIIFWINRFKGGNVADIAYQRAIIDIFVNAIYLYDDKIVLTYNFKSDSRTISLSEIDCSDLPQTAPLLGTNANPTQFFFVGEAFAFSFPLV